MPAARRPGRSQIRSARPARRRCRDRHPPGKVADASRGCRADCSPPSRTSGRLAI